MPDLIETGRIKSMGQQQYTPSRTVAGRIAPVLGPMTTTVTTSTGQQYTLDDKQYNWIQNRYKSKIADTYGYDDADQLAKRNGQLSAAALKTYGKTNVDRQLAELGLPSEKELGKYLEDYSRWHTGGMDQVFGQMNLPKDYWTKTKGFYQADMQKAYENTAEDQQRKARGLMPKKWEDEYTDTEIDEQLRARGLPPISKFGTYAERWNNYQGIDNFYANVARNETNLRLAGIKDDDNEYSYTDPDTGVVKSGVTGKQLYTDAFFDELNKVNDDGSFVYGAIRPLFKNSSSKEPTSTGDYLYDRGAAVLAENKNAVNADDYTSYNAFSYDDYKSKYNDYYERYFANQQTTSGQTVSERLAVQKREEDEEATKKYYSLGDGIDAEAFADRYMAEYPERTFGQMFDDMFAHGMSEDDVYAVSDFLARRATQNYADDKVHGFYDIQRQYAEARQKVIDARNKETESHSFVNAAYEPELDAVSGAAPVPVADATAQRGPKPEEIQSLLTDLDYAVAGYDAAVNKGGSQTAADAANRKIIEIGSKLREYGFTGDNAADDARAWLEANPVKQVAESWEDLVTTGVEAKDKILDLMRDGGWTQANAKKATETLREHGVPEQVIQKGLELLDEEGYQPLFTDDEAVTTPDGIRRVIDNFITENGITKWTTSQAAEVLAELTKRGATEEDVKAVIHDMGVRPLIKMADSFYSNDHMLNQRTYVNEDQASLNEYVDAKLEAQANDEKTISATAASIQAPIARLIDAESDLGNQIDVDAVLSIIDAASKKSTTNPTAMRLALTDLGFLDDELSGWAGDITKGWSDADKRKLKYYLGGNNFTSMTAGEGGANNDWSEAGSSTYSRQLKTEKFMTALEWANQQIVSGEMTEWDAYQVLAASGYQNEMQAYIPEEWHRAHYVESVLPGLWAQAEESERLLYEEMTPEERRAADLEMWNNLSAEKKSAIYDNPHWWKFDPSVYRTFGQALEQQFQAVLPGLGAEIISAPVKVLDAIDAGISGRPEMWETTQNLMEFQQRMGQLGAVTDNVNGAHVAQTAADVVQEIGRMYYYGSIGGAIGAGFAGTSAGAAVMSGAASSSKVVRGASKMFMSMVKSSPFVVSAFANNYAEAKELGAPNNEATWFALITGLSEGILEGFEFDELWGKALGQKNFAELLTAGKHTYLERLGIIGKSWVSSMAVSGLGEFTEESIGYVLETFLKMRHSDTWGKGTEWSTEDWLQQAMMGFITGALGGGIAAGSSFVKDGVALSKALRDNPSLQAALPDVLAAEGIASTIPKATLDAYRKGGATIMSRSALGELDLALNSCLATAKDQIAKYKTDVVEEDAKLNTRLKEIKGWIGKAQAVNVEDASKVGEFVRQVHDNLGITVKLDNSKPILDQIPEINNQVRVGLTSLINDAVKTHDNNIAELKDKTETSLQNSENALKGMQKQVQEHFAGLYLMNEHLHDILSDEMLDNLAQAYQNGAKYEPGQAAEQQAAKQSKLAEAEANETMAEAEQAAETPEDAMTKARELAYNRVYKDQEAGKAYAEGRRGEGDSNMTRVQFAENERQNFQAKTTARLRRVTLELAGLEAKDGMSAKEIFAEAKKAMTPEAAQKLDMYQKLSKALGLNMVVRDVVAGTSGYVHDGKLYVTLNGKQSMLRVASHELTHYMKGHASEQYDALRTHLVNEVGQERFDQMLAEKAQEYSLDLNDAKARLEADDEVCAELCERMLENQDALERFVQSDLDAAKTLKARLGKTLVAIKSAIRSLGTSDAQTKADYIKEQETIESWYKGLSDAIDNANRAKGKTSTATETATVTETTTEAQPQAPPVETNPDLYMGDESARREQLRAELQEMAKRGTRVNDLSHQEVNDVLDRVILGDKSNYSKADYAQIRGMLSQLIPEVQAMVNGGESVDVDALNERVSAALDYMLERYSEGSEDYYGLRDLIPNKIALTEAAYNELRSRDMTLRQASNELRNALGGKFVSFVYKKSPDYNNAMSIDELWTRITDAYGEPDGYGNIQEDALALIDYAKDRNTRTSFDDLYGSQREDVVNAQVGEFLDAVQNMVDGKAAETAALHSIDDDYMPLAERYDAGLATEAETKQLGKDVSQAAEEAGYTELWAHGTPSASFHSFDLGKARGAKAIFLSDLGVASEYASTTYRPISTASIGRQVETVDEALSEFRRIEDGFHQPRKTESGWTIPRSKYITTSGRDLSDAELIQSANELKEKRAGGVYSLFVRPGNKLTVDANGAWWDRIRSPYGTTTDQIGEWARTHGYDSVEIENVHDGGFNNAIPQNIMMVFNPNDVKSTDLVTYDKDGDIIPLSERFDPNKTDIRWTVDDDLNDLVEQYGAIEQGREPRARDVQVPRQVDDRTRVSKLARSAAESPIMSDEHAEKIMNDIEADKDRVKKVWSYIPKSNDEMAQKARDFIADKQPASAQREFHDMVTSGNTSLLTEAVGLQLLADAAMRDDWVSVDELLFDLRVLATDAGQRSQIFNTLKELKGIGSAWYLEKLVAKLNTQYADAIRTGEIDGPITVSDAAMQQVRAAKTQAEVDAAEAVVAKELAVQLPLTWDEKLSNWRFLSMLGNPITHVRNFTGNKLMYGMGGMKDVVAAGVQRLLENTGITDASDRAHALLTPADRKYWDSFVQKSYEEQRSNLQGGGKLGFQSLLQQSKRSFDNKVLDTIARGKNPGVMSEKGRVAGLIENIKNNGAMGMLEVADAWGLEDNYKRSLTEYMKAQGYELRNGVVGKVGKDGSFTEISTEAMNKAIEWASSQAWTNTFRGPSEFATALNKISKINPVMKLFVEGVMPFKKTPVNIAKQGFWYSPAGAIVGTAELLTKVKQGKMSAATAIDHIASGLTGTALMALGVVLAKAHILRGGGEDKKKLETYLEDTGDQTYAFKFGNVSINMSAIAPATIPLFMGVALQEMLSRNGEDEGVDLSTITDVLAGTLNPFMEMSFMSSLNSALKNYNNEGIGGALGSTIMTAAQNYGSQYLPTFGGKVAQFFDPTRRTTKSDATSPVGGNLDYYWRSLVKKVPGAEATLQPDVDIWGRTETKDSFGDWALDFANKFILPTNIKVTNRDNVDNELIRVVESTGVTDFLPSDGNKYFTVNKQKYQMNARQYTQYSQERGQAAYAALKDTMASASYKMASDEDKAAMLKKALDAAYKHVNNQWKEKLGAYDNK